MQILSVEGDRIHCWFMNSGGKGPSFEIDLVRERDGSTLHLSEHPPGTEQEIEVP